MTDPKLIPIPRSLHPHLQWWLKEDNVLTDQPLYPIKPALQIFTDASKEGWGAHLNEHTARGTWSLPESKLHKLIPNPMDTQDPPTDPAINLLGV